MKARRSTLPLYDESWTSISLLDEEPTDMGGGGRQFSTVLVGASWPKLIVYTGRFTYQHSILR
jgi:hypothetical protein